MTMRRRRPASRPPSTEDVRFAGMLLSLPPRIERSRRPRSPTSVARSRWSGARILWQLVRLRDAQRELAQRCALTPSLFFPELAFSLGAMHSSAIRDPTDRRVVASKSRPAARREIERVGELMRAPVAKIIAASRREARAPGGRAHRLQRHSPLLRIPTHAAEMTRNARILADDRRRSRSLPRCSRWTNRWNRPAADRHGAERPHYSPGSRRLPPDLDHATPIAGKLGDLFGVALPPCR